LGTILPAALKNTAMRSVENEAIQPWSEESALCKMMWSKKALIDGMATF
jgi:hypothetical protein